MTIGWGGAQDIRRRRDRDGHRGACVVQPAARRIALYGLHPAGPALLGSALSGDRPVGRGAVARRRGASARAAWTAQHVRDVPIERVQSHNLTELARQLDRDGYRPGKFWAPAISVTQLVGGPMLALGLFTRPVACAIMIFLVVSNYERWRVGGYFWNKTGLEYTLMWTVAVLYFLVHGDGPISVDHLLIRREF